MWRGCNGEVWRGSIGRKFEGPCVEACSERNEAHALTLCVGTADLGLAGCIEEGGSQSHVLMMQPGKEQTERVPHNVSSYRGQEVPCQPPIARYCAPPVASDCFPPRHREVDTRITRPQPIEQVQQGHRSLEHLPSPFPHPLWDAQRRFATEGSRDLLNIFSLFRLATGSHPTRRPRAPPPLEQPCELNSGPCELVVLLRRVCRAAAEAGTAMHDDGSADRKTELVLGCG